VNLFTVLNPTLEKQIAAAARSVEDARRNAHRDPSRLGELVEQINVLAELRQQEGDFRKAESLYREVLFRIQETKKPDPELMVGVYSLIAYLYDRWGKREEAAAHYQKALKMGDQLGTQDADKVATVKNNLAMIHKNMGQLDEARQCYAEALEGFREAHGENSAKVASVYNNLGVLYYQSMEIEEALDLHIRALRIRESLQGREYSAGDLSQTYINLSAAYKAVGDFQKAQDCLENARQISAKTAPAVAEMPEPRRSAAMAVDKPV